jgi:hypothetical protein
MNTESIYEEAYLAIRDGMKVGIPYAWGTVCREFFRIDHEEDTDERTHALQLMKRHTYFSAVNRYAAAAGQSWRLFSHTRGEEIVKRENDDMLMSEVDIRFKRIASGLKLIIDNLSPMLAASGLEKKDRAIIRMMLNLSRGASLSIVGMISQIKFLPKEMRNMAISYFPKEEGE